MQHIDLSAFAWCEHRKYFEEPLCRALMVLSSGVDGRGRRENLTIDGRRIPLDLYKDAARRYFRVFSLASDRRGIALGTVTDLMLLIAEDEAYRLRVGYRSLRVGLPRYRIRQRRSLQDKCLKLLGRLFSYSMFYHGRGWRLDGTNLVTITLKNNCVMWDAWTFIRRLQDHCDVLYCPYCNAETIYAVSGVATKTGRMESHLDHFFPQNRYPYLSVSLSNLVPACSRCNSGGKSSANTAEITVTPTDVAVSPTLLHPYLESFHAAVRFEYEKISARLLSGCGRKEDVLIKAGLVPGARVTAARETLSEFGLIKFYEDCFWRDFADLPARMVLAKTCKTLALKKFLESKAGFNVDLFNRLTGELSIESGSINKERLSKVKHDLAEQLAAGHCEGMI